MKENFPDLAKEIDFQEVQEAQSPKEIGPKEAHTKAHHIITLAKIKVKERILKAARKKESYLQSSSHKTLSWFLKGNLAGKKGLEGSIQSHGRQEPARKITVSSIGIN